MSVELNKTLDYLKSQLNDQVVVDKLQAYIKDLEGQRNWAQQEYSRVQGQLEQTDYDLENHKRWLKVAGDEINEMKDENRLLKGLVKKWA
jgi:chromosome segregation ATPase